jgi:hypothetical protein
MTRRTYLLALFAALVFASIAVSRSASVEAASQADPSDAFRTSDRCVACHNGMKTSKGQDVSIGFAWRATMMANAARDPYWQGSVRRETIDHPESSEEIQNECSTCHMPMQHLMDRMQDRKTAVLSRLPLKLDSKEDAAAADGVSCSVCHQIKADGLGTPATYVGQFVVAGPEERTRPEYGPYVVDDGRVMLMHSSTAGYTPVQAAHIREAGLCGSCHTLYTTARGPGGKDVGRLPEQMPYLEWLHSDYRDKQTCQQCHMPKVEEPVQVASLFGVPRDDVHQHTFVGSNFLLEGMLDAHRDELAVTALPAEFAAATKRTREFLQSQSARVAVTPPQLSGNDLAFAVRVDNLGGHKLPTAYPSRRAWLHVTVKAANGTTVFESGNLNPDGSIAGNANDKDAKRFSPHYTTITSPDQVQIFESILGDSEGQVTTGLIAATQYLKDNRVLPTGFDKQTADRDIAVVGDALADPAFVAGNATTSYRVPTGGAGGPFRISVELVYQPVGYRWAHNLGTYQAAEPKRFVGYYEKAASQSALVLAHAEATAQVNAASAGQPLDVKQ